MNSKYAIGIDLGTTFSVVAASRDGKVVEIIANQYGNRTTPSCVAFNETDRLIGEGATQQVQFDPENTIYAAKRLIGREFDDPAVQRDIKNLLYAVVEEKDRLRIRVKHKGQTKYLYPEEISALVLSNIRKFAEEYVGHEIKDVVISIPAYFNHNQREATKTAAEIAGLNVIHMIHEPTAAAFAYGAKLTDSQRKNVLIYDFGGGTFDVSILTIENNDYKVRTIKGDSNLGGEDIDTLLVKHFTEEFKRKQKTDISGDKRVLRHLRTHCEKGKRYLSSQMKTKFTLEGTNLSGEITRARFEDLCDDLFEKSISLVKEALEDAKMSKHEIDDIVLAGGSSRIPRVQELLKEYFDGKELCKTINPDECVAYGAAVQAAALQKTQADKGPSLSDVCPLSLGIELSNGQMETYISRGTAVPTKYVKTLQAANARSKTILVKIYEGERYMCEDNKFLGQFELDGIKSSAEGGGFIDITFDVDANGILKVSAIEPITGVQKNISIDNKNVLSKDEKACIVKDAAKEAISSRAEDEKTKKREEALVGLQGLCFKLKRRVKLMSSRGQIENADKEMFVDKCDEILSWLDENQDETQKEFDKKRTELKMILEKIEDLCATAEE